MAVSREASGTLSIVDTDGETTLHTIATTGAFMLYADLNDLDDGETVIFRIKGPVLTGGTRRIIDEAIYSNQMGSEKIKRSDVHLNIVGDTNDLQFTAETEGVTVAVSIPWSIHDLGGA